ncbi:pinopsin-like [Stylophora pistillata]|uniref:pinopsin-like n=1 Tax=Stylophora pistillata TaxID=50429 RepID=UPI000C04C64D|nr:pinopsin-like [Stylophora pistillata]
MSACNISTQAPSIAQTLRVSQGPQLRPNDTGVIVYIVVMAVILAVGFIGNVLTILVLSCHEHKNKNITPFMMNLAIADIIIIVFGYPVVVAANFTSSGLNVRNSRTQCIWSGFINGSVGIASIANLTMMSLLMYSAISKVSNNTKIPRRKMAIIIILTWVYGVIAMVPPLVGWNEFVPGASGISCCPNWSPQTKAGVAYNMLLVFVGFVLPLTVIVYSYHRIYRYIRSQRPMLGSASIQAIRRKSEIKVVRMIAMSIAAFVLSWSPYTFVSIMATIRGTNVLTPDSAEVPDLLAKAWVIYNPIVYTAMNDRFRRTLMRILPIRCIFGKGLNPWGNTMSLTVESRPTHAYTIQDLPRDRTQSVV